MLTWRDRAFAELDVAELYAIVALRERVFVVEQRCAYLDADGLDRDAHHLYATRDGDVVAYLRLLAPGARFAEPSLGRIVTAPALRGTGVGRELVRRGIALARARHGERAIRIAAQAHLERFYGEFGFARAGDPFDEDGIPHVEMVLA